MLRAPKSARKTRSMRKWFGRLLCVSGVYTRILGIQTSKYKIFVEWWRRGGGLPDFATNIPMFAANSGEVPPPARFQIPLFQLLESLQ